MANVKSKRIANIAQRPQRKTNQNKARPSTLVKKVVPKLKARPASNTQARAKAKPELKPGYAAKRLKEAAELLKLVPGPNNNFTLTYLRSEEECGVARDVDALEPMIAQERWGELPGWVKLHADRAVDEPGLAPLCFFGHRLIPNNAPRYSACYKCGVKPIPPGTPVLWCWECDFWSICEQCVALPRYHSLKDDPLFHGKHSPCLIDWSERVKDSRGTVIICPGGNYEFLVANEAEPVSNWLADNGIYSVVLRYRVLPEYGLDDALDDLRRAVDHIRATRSGPVVGMGFSAGGHLLACLPVELDPEDGKNEARMLDGQVLVYPGINAVDWVDPIKSSFVNWKRCLRKSPSLLTRQPALLGGPGFAAPPTLLVSSIYDNTCPPEEHSDRYYKSLQEAYVPSTHIRKEYGDHGFGIDEDWVDDCIPWLRSLGFTAASGA